MTERDRVLDAFRNCITEPKCKDCPWTECEILGNDTIEIPRDLALAVMRQLVAQEPRVMTLEEVRAAEVVWLEQVGACVCAIKIQNYDSGTMSFAYAYNNYTSFVNIKQEYYGKISRCWTARPTDEQRKAAKWDDA